MDIEIITILEYTKDICLQFWCVFVVGIILNTWFFRMTLKDVWEILNFDIIETLKEMRGQ